MERTLLLTGILCVSLVTGLSSHAHCQSEPVDAFSGASTRNHFVKSSLEAGEILKVIENKDAAFVLSTTNPDGSPNAAVFIPGVDSHSVLKFGLAQNQTLLNIERTKEAVLTVYRFLPDQPKGKRHQGARLVLELIEVKSKKEKRYTQVKMEIKKILPIG